jgi:broad specificity phosphatase PhoE
VQKRLPASSARCRVNAIYATQYKRTQETAKPLSDKTGVPVTIVSSKNGGPARRFARKHSGHTNLHRRAQQHLCRRLLRPWGPKYPVIPETEYDKSICRDGLSHRKSIRL